MKKIKLYLKKLGKKYIESSKTITFKERMIISTISSLLCLTICICINQIVFGIGFTVGAFFV